MRRAAFSGLFEGPSMSLLLWNPYATKRPTDVAGAWLPFASV